MKRSERLKGKASDRAMAAAMIFLCSVCAGVWSIRAGQSTVPGGALVLAVALVGFRAAWWYGSEALRLLRLAGEEARWEWRREVRPRL